jgi:hypothetical protein
MKDNTVLLVIALAFAIAGGVMGVMAKAWAIVLIAAAAVLVAVALLF